MPGNPISLAIVGAATAIGESLVEALAESGLSIGAVRFVDADEAITGRIEYDGHYQSVAAIEDFDFSGIDLVVFAGRAELAWQYIDRAREAGCRVIDLTAASRLETEVPLLVAGLFDPAAIDPAVAGLVACPDPVSTQLALLLYPLLSAGHRVTRVDCVACRSVTMQGRAGSEALAYETVQLLNMRQPERLQYGRQIAFNLLPRPADEAAALAVETKKILNNQDIELNIRLLDSPVFQANSLQCFIDFAEPASLDACTQAWSAQPQLLLHEDDEAPSAVTEASGHRQVVLGGLTGRADGRPGMSVWSVMDSLAGQSGNALSVAEILVKSVL